MMLGGITYLSYLSFNTPEYDMRCLRQSRQLNGTTQKGASCE